MVAASTNEAVRLSLCSICQLPAHASETDDLDRCATCRPQLPLLWRMPDEAYGRYEHLLVEVRWLPFDADAGLYAPRALTTVLTVAVRAESSDDCGEMSYEVSDHHTLSGSALDDTAFETLNIDLAAWATYNAPRSRSTSFCADRMRGSQSTCVGNKTWERAKVVISKLEAERAS